MNKTSHISTLVEDIYKVIQKGKVPSEEHLDLFCANLKIVLKEQLSRTEKPNNLRMSNIGFPDRKLWYTINQPKKSDDLSPTSLLTFMFGNIVEEFVFLLCRHAGHSITDEQRSVVLEGIEGHMDGRIDGIVSDVKGMSPFGFNKFKSGSILQGEDPYGYIQQLSGYAQAQNEEEAAFLAFNKATGELCLRTLDEYDLKDAGNRIRKAKVFIADPKPPKRCYEPVAKGKSGNMILSKGCEFCGFKEHCWSDANDGEGLKAFEYSTGITYFTKIVKAPRVKEED